MRACSLRRTPMMCPRLAARHPCPRTSTPTHPSRWLLLRETRPSRDRSGNPPSRTGRRLRTGMAARRHMRRPWKHTRTRAGRASCRRVTWMATTQRAAHKRPLACTGPPPRPYVQPALRLFVFCSGALVEGKNASRAHTMVRSARHDLVPAHRVGDQDLPDRVVKNTVLRSRHVVTGAHTSQGSTA